LKRNNKMRVGIDIGGTTVKLGFVDNYKIIYKEEIKTTKESLFVDIKNKINEIKEKYNYDIEGLGFGVPGNVKNNYIFNMPNVGLKDVNLNELFKEYKICSSNDANVAACDNDVETILTINEPSMQAKIIANLTR